MGKPERNLETKQSHKKREVVSFVDTVKVLPIPKRDEYSDRVAKRMGSSAVEIQEMAMRNSVEFAAEGWDWRTVTEDEQMYVCTETGELVHPVHFGNNYCSECYDLHTVGQDAKHKRKISTLQFIFFIFMVCLLLCTFCIMPNLFLWFHIH